MAGEDKAPSQAHPAVVLESTMHLLLLLLPRTIGNQPAWPQLFPLPGPGLLQTPVSEAFLCGGGETQMPSLSEADKTSEDPRSNNSFYR